jgi:hypothetical protein
LGVIKFKGHKSRALIIRLVSFQEKKEIPDVFPRPLPGEDTAR